MITGPNLITDGLVLYLDGANKKSYPGSGTTWYDLSGNGNNGTLTNGPTFDSNNGKSSIVFDGVNDVVYCGMENYVWGSELSVFVWLKNIGGDYRAVINTGYYSSGNWEMRFGREDYFGGTNNGTRLGCLVNTVNGFKSLNLNGDLNLIGCYGMVYDGNTLKVYKNGILFDSTSHSGNILNYSKQVTIGTRDPSSYLQIWNSNIYQTQIYNRALTSQEVLQNYNATKSRFGLI